MGEEQIRRGHMDEWVRDRGGSEVLNGGNNVTGCTMRDHRMVHIPVIDKLSTFLADAIKHC